MFTPQGILIHKFSSISIYLIQLGNDTNYHAIWRFGETSDEDAAIEGYIEFSDIKQNWVLTTIDNDVTPGLDASDLVHIAEFMLALEEINVST